MPTKISQAKYYDRFYITGKTPSRYDRIKVRAWNKKYYDKLRNEILFHYSNGTMKCNCCGESHLEFLALDHINGGGKQHRKQVKNFYMMLRRENYSMIQKLNVVCEFRAKERLISTN